jgi:hypothetical protein
MDGDNNRNSQKQQQKNRHSRDHPRIPASRPGPKGGDDFAPAYHPDMFTGLGARFAAIAIALAIRTRKYSRAAKKRTKG